MINVLDTVTCSGLGAPIDKVIPDTIALVVTIIKIAVPILLVLFGMLDLGKAVMSNDEKEMKGAQGKLIKRVLYAVLVFFIIAITQWVIALVDTDKDASSCFNCFVNGDCSKVTSED